jgi:hypothetical protein
VQNPSPSPLFPSKNAPKSNYSPSSATIFCQKITTFAKTIIMKNIHLLFLTLALLCGCSSFEEQNTLPSLQSADELRVGFADNTTKTYIENGKYLRWHADDRLTAFFGNTLNRQYRFKGETGDNSGTFALVPNGFLDRADLRGRFFGGG